MVLSIPFDNQITAATEMQQIFAAGEIHSIFLNADVQSGKTGCFQTLIRRMLQSRMVDQAYILCGSSETELYDQAKADTLAYNADLADKITVIFRQDFFKHVLNIKRTLIVVDESHLDQDTSQMLAKYLAKYGLGMDGTRPEMLVNKTYIVSVDATGYSEFCAMQGGKSLPKAVVDLHAGIGYFGPKQYYLHGVYSEELVHATFDIDAEPARFQGLFRPGTWNLMRLPGRCKREYVARIRALCDEVGVDVFLFNSSHNDVEISCKRCDAGEAHVHAKPCLAEAPTRPSLVLLNGRLRAGKVVPKQHIGFVWEGGDSSRTDAVIQGLLGRMCGYKFGAQKPMIFLPSGIITRKERKEMEHCELERHFLMHSEGSALPTKAMNIIAGRNPTKQSERNRCPPIRLALGEDIEHLDADPRRTDKKHLKQICMRLLDEKMDEIRAHPTMTPAQKEEIEMGLLHLMLMPSVDDMVRPVHLRFITRTSAASQVSFTNALMVAEQEKTVPLISNDITKLPFLSFVVVYPDANLNEKPMHATPGDIFAIFYTEAANSNVLVKPEETRYGKVKEGCAFVRRTLAVSTESAASSSIGLTQVQLATPAIFKAALRTFVRHQLELEDEEFAVSNCLQFHAEHRTFKKAQFFYTSSTNHAIKTLLVELGAEMRLRFECKLVQGTSRGDTFQVKEIAWKRR